MYSRYTLIQIFFEKKQYSVLSSVRIDRSLPVAYLDKAMSTISMCYYEKK